MGTMKHYKMSEDVRDNLKKLVGQDSVVNGIEIACSRYLTIAEDERLKAPQREVNNKLMDIHNCASALASLLGDNTVIQELRVLVLSEPYSRKTAGYDGKLKDLRKNMELLARITENISPLPKGRQKGRNNKAASHLAFSLYTICKKAGLNVKRVNTGSGPIGLLHKILDILREPLGIGEGQLNGVFDSAIIFLERENAKQTEIVI